MRFRSFLAPIAALSLAAIGGCSSSTDTTGPGNTTACSITLSGALSGTYACTNAAATAAYATASATSAVAFSLASPAVNAAISIPGELAQTTYTQASTGVSGGITVTSGSSVYYAVVSGSSTTGTFSMNLSSVSTYATTASGKAYTVHGTVNGTLVPAGGSGASITFSATF